MLSRRMREGLIPSTVTTVLRLATTAEAARAVTELFGEVFDSDNTGVAAFEDEKTGAWLIDVYFGEPPDEAMVRELIASVAGEDDARNARFDAIEEKDWVAASLDGLKPVEAGRFLVHGRHDRARVAGRDNCIRIEIEAALAFGTGHHGTTLGCLRTFDDLLRRRRPMRVLDVGSGTGVLAIAASRALRRRVIASDIDPVAVEVAQGNARANAAGGWIGWAVGPGLRHPVIAGKRPYDLIFANILAKPLTRMAPAIANALAPGGEIILSGLLVRDVPGVASAYRACGLALADKREIEGWMTLLMRRGGAGVRPRRRVNAL